MSSNVIDGDRTGVTLAAAVDAVARLDPDDLDTADLAVVLVGLRRSIDRLEGEFARLTTAADTAGVWAADGAVSMATWLSRRTGIGLGRARAAAELGAAMDTVPELDTAVRSGELSPDTAATVIAAVDDPGFPDSAGALIAEIAGMTPTRAARHVETWRAVANPVDDTERRRTAFDQRGLRFRPAGDGMTRIDGVIPNETARTLRLALAHLAEAQRLDGTDRTRPQRMVDALGDLAAAYTRGEITGGRNLPRIIVTLTLDDLEHRRPGRDTFTGQPIPSSEIERLCCDSIIHRYIADQPNARLHFGRGRRTATPHQWLTMVARDHGCRHPGCDRPPQWCQAHHLREFAARGGLTDIDEMVLLCHHHHHALHDDAWTLTGTPHHLTFTGPAGQTLHSSLPRHDTKKAA